MVNSRGANAALIVGHMAGMIDLAALPVWVGTLISGYALGPAQAGGLATLFLGGVVVSSVLLSPFFHRVPGGWMPTIGFGIASAAFLSMTRLTGFPELALAHLVAGLANGLAISFIHGTMARTFNPHRIFAFGGIALGFFAVFFLATAPGLIATHGAPVLFLFLSAAMATGAVVTALFFPASATNEDVLGDQRRFRSGVWFAILGIMCMALVHAMVFSFAERIGIDGGFTPDMVGHALVLSGLVAILPSALAALLEKRLPAIGVAIGGAVVQAVMANMIARATGYGPYLAGVVVFPFIMLFTHTFVFGYLARIEPSGRANAATPAMIMTGSATAPLLGGVLVEVSGYQALGLAAAVFAAIAVMGFSLSRKLAA